MSKKYFVFSDVHGFYDELMIALNKNGFDINNPDHIIISCGDLMDRGPKPLECLKFVNDLPDERKVLIKGNHELLFKEIFKNKTFEDYDFSNGTLDTYVNIYKNTICNEIDNKKKKIDYYPLIMLVNEVEDVEEYFNSLVNFYETDKYIFIHSWIPEYSFKKQFNENWRNASQFEWSKAMWNNPFEKATVPENLVDNKTFVFGHWHTSWARRYLDGHSYNSSYEAGDNACFDIYKGKQFIGIDGCTAFSGQVNILVLDESEI